MAFGYSPVVANVTNNVGLVAGGLTGTFGYRAELADQRRRAITLAAFAVSGALLGAVLLLTLPESTFNAVVPVLIGAALVLVVVQPWLGARLEERRRRQGVHPGRWTPLGVFAVGVYGGYFGGAQGIMLLAVLGIGLTETLQRVNALKNALSSANNITAACVFVFAAPGRLGRGRAARGRLGGRRPLRCAAGARPSAFGAPGDHRDRRDRGDRQAHGLTADTKTRPSSRSRRSGSPKHSLSVSPVNVSSTGPAATTRPSRRSSAWLVAAGSSSM